MSGPSRIIEPWLLDREKRMSERESEDRMTNEQALIFLELNCLATSQDQKEMKVEAVRTLRALIKEGIYDERTNETCD